MTTRHASLSDGLGSDGQRLSPFARTHEQPGVARANTGSPTDLRTWDARGMKVETFGLIHTRRDTALDGGATTDLRRDGVRKTETTFWDFTKGGNPLLPALSKRAPLDVVSVIQDEWPIESVEAVQRLLGEAPGDLPDGRISIYVCPECGDLGCGAITARLRFAQGEVIWNDIGWQADYDDGPESLDDEGGWKDAHFDRTTYESILRGEVERLTPLASTFEYPYQRERRQRLQFLRVAVPRKLLARMRDQKDSREVKRKNH